MVAKTRPTTPSSTMSPILSTRTEMDWMPSDVSEMEARCWGESSTPGTGSTQTGYATDDPGNHITVVCPFCDREEGAVAAMALPGELDNDPRKALCTHSAFKLLKDVLECQQTCVDEGDTTQVLEFLSQLEAEAPKLPHRKLAPYLSHKGLLASKEARDNFDNSDVEEDKSLGEGEAVHEVALDYRRALKDSPRLSIVSDAIMMFLNTGAKVTVFMPNVMLQQSFVETPSLKEPDPELVTLERHSFPIKGTEKSRYGIQRLVGDWGALAGAHWTPRAEGWGRRGAQVGRKGSSTKIKRIERWSEAQRKTVAVTLLQIVLGTHDLDKHVERPAPSRASTLGSSWEWAAVYDSQKIQDEDVNRMDQLVAVLDAHRLLPKVVLAGDREILENLRTPGHVMKRMERKEMQVDSLGEFTKYSLPQVLFFILGVLGSTVLGLTMGSGVGFCFLAVLCVRSLEQEISFSMFLFVLKRVTFLGRVIPREVGRPHPGNLANYLLFTIFGCVEVAYDQGMERWTDVADWIAIAASVLTLTLTVPPALFIARVRYTNGYYQSLSLTAAEQLDWARESAGYFFGSCRECVVGGVGPAYRCGDQGGRLFCWLSACEERNVVWNGTVEGGVHHSYKQIQAVHGRRWTVVGSSSSA